MIPEFKLHVPWYWIVFPILGVTIGFGIWTGAALAIGIFYGLTLAMGAFGDWFHRNFGGRY